MEQEEFLKLQEQSLRLEDEENRIYGNYIPEKYSTSCIQSTRWKHNPKNNYPIFTKEDEEKAVTIIEDILGEDLCILDNDMIALLKITKEMENLYVALIYTSYE